MCRCPRACERRGADHCGCVRQVDARGVHGRGRWSLVCPALLDAARVTPFRAASCRVEVVRRVSGPGRHALSTPDSLAHAPTEAFRASRHRLDRGVPRRLRGHPIVGGHSLLRPRVDRALLHRSSLSLHLLRVWVDLAMAGEWDVRPLRRTRRARGRHYARCVVSSLLDPVLRRVHLRLPPRPDAVSESLLLG